MGKGEYVDGNDRSTIPKHLFDRIPRRVHTKVVFRSNEVVEYQFVVQFVVGC